MWIKKKVQINVAVDVLLFLFLFFFFILFLCAFQLAWHASVFQNVGMELASNCACNVFIWYIALCNRHFTVALWSPLFRDVGNAEAHVFMSDLTLCFLHFCRTCGWQYYLSAVIASDLKASAIPYSWKYSGFWNSTLSAENIESGFSWIATCKFARLSISASFFGNKYPQFFGSCLVPCESGLLIEVGPNSYYSRDNEHLYWLSPN